MALPTLPQIVSLLLRYKYTLVFPFGIAEGPILTVICGFLMRLGYFHFWPLYLLLIFADLVGDFFWYAFGYFGARHAVARYGKFVSLHPEVVEKIKDKFRKHQNKTLIVSKLTTGFGFAIVTLTTAGIVRVPLKNFTLINLFGGFIWTGILLTIGYFFGHFYTQIDSGLRLGTSIGFVIILLALLYGLQRYMRQSLIKKTA